MLQEKANDSLLELPLFALLLTLQLSLADAAETVFRCTSADGHVEFSQRPCAPGTKDEEISLEDRRVGWEAPRVALKLERKNSSGQKRKKDGPSKASRQAKKKQEKDCWKKKQQV